MLDVGAGVAVDEGVVEVLEHEIVFLPGLVGGGVTLTRHEEVLGLVWIGFGGEGGHGSGCGGWQLRPLDHWGEALLLQLIVDAGEGGGSGGQLLEEGADHGGEAGAGDVDLFGEEGFGHWWLGLRSSCRRGQRPAPEASARSSMRWLRAARSSGMLAWASAPMVVLAWVAESMRTGPMASAVRVQRW